MALDSTGLTIKRAPEILEELNAGIKERLGSNVDTSAFSLMGNFHSNLAIRLAQLYELSQALYDAGNLYNAEGVGLDNLGIQVGVSRKPATRTEGIAYFEGADGVSIPANTIVATGRGDEFFNTTGFTISSSNCVKTRVYIGLLVDSTEYKVNLDGVDYTHTSDASATYQEVLEGLQTSVDLSGLVTTTVVLDAESPENSYLELDKDDKNTSMTVSGISYIVFDYNVTPQRIYSKEYGPIVGDALTITNIITGVTNWYSVTNPSDFSLGTSIETDNDFRIRILNEFNAVGSGTVDSIATALVRLDGVEDVIVKENTGDTTDAESIPAKSFEVVVNGGLDDDIAQTIWANKPAGIYAHGSEIVDIVDFNGYEKTIRFSRATIKYITIRVTYSLYSEEDFPSGAIDAAKTAILLQADDTLSMGSDVIAKRFLGAVYGAATGFGDITIEVATKDNPNDTVLEGDYQDVIAISDREVTSFSTTRMVFQTA